MRIGGKRGLYAARAVCCASSTTIGTCWPQWKICRKPPGGDAAQAMVPMWAVTACFSSTRHALGVGDAEAAEARYGADTIVHAQSRRPRSCREGGLTPSICP